MAKNNIYLGTLSGKLGDNVWWRTHGQQRVRTYFKREDVAVGYEAAERQSRFANLKSIYQWLPDDFKKACNLYKVGGNPYADFMRQYNDYGMGRDKQGFGAGRFLPVECSISNGTFNVNPPTKWIEGSAATQTVVQPVIQILAIPISPDAENIANWSEVSEMLLNTYTNLREGDYFHILLGMVRYTETPWGEPDAVAGFPFAYSTQRHVRLKIDTHSDINFMDGEQLGLYIAYGDIGMDDTMIGFGFGYSWQYLPIIEYGNCSIVTSYMFERPTNTRQQRYSPAKLKFNRSQLEILSPTMRSRWNDYAAQSYVRVL